MLNVGGIDGSPSPRANLAWKCEQFVSMQFGCSCPSGEAARVTTGGAAARMLSHSSCSMQRRQGSSDPREARLPLERRAASLSDSRAAIINYDLRDCCGGFPCLVIVPSPLALLAASDGVWDTTTASAGDS